MSSAERAEERRVSMSRRKAVVLRASCAACNQQRSESSTSDDMGDISKHMV